MFDQLVGLVLAILALAYLVYAMLGGALVPFLGIKLIDMLLAALHLT